MFRIFTLTMCVVVSLLCKKQLTDAASYVSYQAKKPAVTRKWNQEHLSKLNQGRAIWNKWREKYPDIKPNLTGTNLEDQNLEGYNLSLTNLSWVNLRGANLRNALLHGSNLSNAKLNAADLRGAEFCKGEWRRVPVSGTVFCGRPYDPRLACADVSSADLRNVITDDKTVIKSSLESVCCPDCM